MEDSSAAEFQFQIEKVLDIFYPGELSPCLFCSEKTSSVNNTVNDASAKIFCDLLNVKSSFASGFLLAPICSKCSETIDSMVQVYNSIQALEIQLQFQKETLFSYLKREDLEILYRHDHLDDYDEIFENDVFSPSKFRKTIQAELGFNSILHVDQTTESPIAVDSTNELDVNLDDVQDLFGFAYLDTEDSVVNSLSVDVGQHECPTEIRKHENAKEVDIARVAKNAENAKEVKNVGNAKEVKNVENAKAVKNVENEKEITNVENAKGTGKQENAGVQEITKEVKRAESINTEKTQQEKRLPDKVTENQHLIKKCCVQLMRIQALDDAAMKIINDDKVSRPAGKIIFQASNFEPLTSDLRTKELNPVMLGSPEKSQHDQHQPNTLSLTQMKSSSSAAKITNNTDTVSQSTNSTKKRDFFVCDNCGEDFNVEENFIRHQFKFHRVPLPNRCWKDSCKLDFTSAEELKQHQEIHHPSFQCEKCGKTLRSQPAFTKHLKVVHGENRIVKIIANPQQTKPSDVNNVSGYPFICEVCNYGSRKGSIFKKHTESKKHIALMAENSSGNSIPGKKAKVYSCEACNYHTTKRNHMKTHNDTYIHKYSIKAASKDAGPTKSKFTCPEANCEFFAFRFFLLDQHLEFVHGIQQEIEELHFPSKKDFETWKENLQGTDNVKYNAQKSGPRVKKYYCNRTGCHKSKSKGVRKLKSLGSVKTGKTCPSRLLVKVLPEGGVEIKYHKTHVGHDKDPRRFGLTREQKLELAKSLAEGFTKDELIEKFKSGCTDTNKRIHFTSKADLHNITAHILPKLDKSVPENEDKPDFEK